MGKIPHTSGVRSVSVLSKGGIEGKILGFQHRHCCLTVPGKSGLRLSAAQSTGIGVCSERLDRHGVVWSSTVVPEEEEWAR